MTTDQNATTTAAPPRGDLLSAVGRFWWVVLIATILGAAAGASWASFSPQQYTSRVTLVVQIPDGADSETLVRTVEALITSNAVLDKIAQESDLGLSEEKLKERISVERPTGSAVVEVSVNGGDPDSIDAVAQELVPALEEAITELPGEAQEEETEPSIEVTNLQLDPEVVALERSLVRDTALGAIGGLVVGMLAAAAIAGRRPRRS